MDFDGGRDESSLTAFATEKWQLQLPPPEVCRRCCNFNTLCNSHLYVAFCVTRPRSPAFATKNWQVQLLPPEVRPLLHSFPNYNTCDFMYVF